MAISTRRMQLGCAVAIVLGVATSALAQPFAYASRPPPQRSTRDTQFLTVIDVARRAKVTTIALGESLPVRRRARGGVARRARVYVSNFWSNTVSVVDTATDGVIQDLPRSHVSWRTRRKPDGTRLYINTFIQPG